MSARRECPVPGCWRMADADKLCPDCERSVDEQQFEALDSVCLTKQVYYGDHPR